MKYFFMIVSALCCVVTFSSCIDKEYDLTQIDTEDVVIGNDDSEFCMPLLTVHVTSADICQNVGAEEVSIKNLYENLSMWVPATLPGGVVYVDVPRLMAEDEYFDAIFDALYDEIQSNEQKRMSVCLYLVREHRAQLIDILLELPNSAIQIVANGLNKLSDEVAAQILSELVVNYSDIIKEVLRELATVDVDALVLKDIDVDIPSLDISQDIRDMLSDNLDPASDSTPTNALYIEACIDSEFPFTFQLSPAVDGTMIKFGNLTINYGSNEIDQIRIYEEDLHAVIYGSHLSMPISVLRYYPYVEFDDESEIQVHLSVRKTGGLTI